jgi:hypothetical protein
MQWRLDRGHYLDRTTCTRYRHDEPLPRRIGTHQTRQTILIFTVGMNAYVPYLRPLILFLHVDEGGSWSVETIHILNSGNLAEISLSEWSILFVLRCEERVSYSLLSYKQDVEVNDAMPTSIWQTADMRCGV